MHLGLKVTPNTPGYDDTGTASRFFPVLPWERADFPDYPPFKYEPKASRSDRGHGNDWPTVKPLALMKWLITLTVPPNGTVLDPFLGSGTTLKAAKELGFRAIGIDQDAHACELAASRLVQEVLAFDFGDAAGSG